MKTPESVEEMTFIINEWVGSADGHDCMDRQDMVCFAGEVLSIIKFMESDIIELLAKGEG